MKVLLGSCVILVSKVTDVQRTLKNKEKRLNYAVNFLYFAVSPFATCDGFSQITSHIEIEC